MTWITTVTMADESASRKRCSLSMRSIPSSTPITVQSENNGRARHRGGALADSPMLSFHSFKFHGLQTLRDVANVLH